MAKYNTVITPNRTVALEASEFWERRELLYFFTWRNFKVRYKQTAIGALWAMFRPLILMVVFTLTFNKVANVNTGSSEIPYPIFAYAGLMYWSYFSQTVTQVGGSLVSYQGIIQKIYFPRLMIPVSTAITGMIDFFFAAIIYIAMCFYFGVYPSILGIVMLLPMLLLAFIATLGIGLYMASLNVKYRDVGQALPFFVQAMLFLTPVVYPVELVPDSYKWVLYLNPMTGVVDTMQASLLNIRPVNYRFLSISIISSLVILFLALVYFKAKEREIADII